MDWLDYREKLGIGFNDTDKNQYFYTNMCNSFNLFRTRLSAREYYKFYTTIGQQIDRFKLENESMAPKRYEDCINVLFSCNMFPDFLAYVVAFINSLDPDEDGHQRKAIYLAELESKLTDAHLAYEIIKDGDNSFVFPKGIVEFDDALISQPLEWLKDYPEAEKAWSKALREYANEESEKASDVADLFRKAIEAFFKQFFGTKKSIENLKAEYGKYLNSKGIPSEIKQNFETLLQAYTNYMNGYAKHRDATSDKVLEYLMYQTGNIMRLLITLKQGEQQDAD